MRDYAEVDPVIDAWAQVTVEKLFTEWAGRPDRFAYLPGLRPFECFQIAIEPPLAGRITVFARSVDTDDGREFKQRWDGEVNTLSTMLDMATKTVREWVNRSQAIVR